MTHDKDTKLVCPFCKRPTVRVYMDSFSEFWFARCEECGIETRGFPTRNVLLRYWESQDAARVTFQIRHEGTGITETGLLFDEALEEVKHFMAASARSGSGDCMTIRLTPEEGGEV